MLFRSIGMVVIEDSFGMGLTESTIARIWREKPDLDVLGKELDSTLCGWTIHLQCHRLTPPTFHHFQFGGPTT